MLQHDAIIFRVCQPTVEFWRNALQLPVIDFQASIIKEGFWPTTVTRIFLQYANGTGPRSVILKCAQPNWVGDAWGAQREASVYRDLLSRIPVAQPACYFISEGGNQEPTQIVLQDLADAYAFYPETHVWSVVEASAMLRSYARLHTAAQTLDVKNCPYLMLPLCERWTPQGARKMVSDLLQTSWAGARLKPVAPFVEILLDELPSLARVAAGEPITLVHYDAYPPNVGFSFRDESADAVLIDWALATRDIAEIDVAALFQQPYRSNQQLDWRAMLRYYWDERARLTGEAYDWQERVMLLRYARIQLLFAALGPIHLAWEKAEREGKPFTPDAPDPYTRFYNATLDVMIEIVKELMGKDNG